MKKIIGFLGFALLLSATTHAETLYQIELIAFARSGAEADENWDRQYDLHYPERYVNLHASDGSNSSFQLLPTDAMQLNKETDAIAGRRNLHVLLHAAWRQTVDDPAHATAVIISGGKPFGTHHELEGTFTLSVEHFLRADANLWLSRFSSNTAEAPAKTQTLPNPPGAIAPVADDGAHYVATQTVVLQEQRRLRSGELHYFDHPRMGLIVLVTPVATAQ